MVRLAPDWLICANPPFTVHSPERSNAEPNGRTLTVTTSVVAETALAESIPTIEKALTAVPTMPVAGVQVRKSPGPTIVTPDTTFEVTPLCVIVRLPLATWAG